MGKEAFRGEGGNRNPNEFIRLEWFMFHKLGINGATINVYARIYGFNINNREYYESAKSLASFMNINEKTVRRSLADLVKKGLIEECGMHVPKKGRSTKKYRVTISVLARVAGLDVEQMVDKMPAIYGQTEDKLSSRQAEHADKMPEMDGTNCLPISKRENKDYR